MEDRRQVRNSLAAGFGFIVFLILFAVALAGSVARAAEASTPALRVPASGATRVEPAELPEEASSCGVAESCLVGPG